GREVGNPAHGQNLVASDHHDVLQTAAGRAEPGVETRVDCAHDVVGTLRIGRAGVERVHRRVHVGERVYEERAGSDAGVLEASQRVEGDVGARVTEGAAQALTIGDYQGLGAGPVGRVRR